MAGQAGEQPRAPQARVAGRHARPPVVGGTIARSARHAACAPSASWRKPSAVADVHPSDLRRSRRGRRPSGRRAGRGLGRGRSAGRARRRPRAAGRRRRARSTSSCSRRASSWPLLAAPVPRRRAACRSRASSTRSRSRADELRPARASSEPSGRWTWTSRSRRSRSGPLSRRRCRARSPSEQRQRSAGREPAGAGVRRGDEHEPRREDRAPLPADDHRPAVLERLAERLEGRARELAELVEEQHAVVGQARLAGHGDRAAADEPGGADGVVRRAEGAVLDEPAAVRAGPRRCGCA